MRTRAEISGGDIFFPSASTQASSLPSALTILYGTISMSRCTTSSVIRRPMRRFTANRVLSGLVTAWRFADCPTSTSESAPNATMDGVVRSPSLFSMTRGLLPSMTATQEFVVPRSMPMVLAIADAPGCRRVLQMRNMRCEAANSTGRGSFRGRRLGSLRREVAQSGYLATITMAGRTTRPFNRHPFWNT